MKILARNLARTTTEAELRTLFEAFGKVQYCTLAIDKESGASKGFGFIEMPRPGDAKAAVKSLNGKDVAGNKIRVKKAEQKITEQKPADSVKIETEKAEPDKAETEKAELETAKTEKRQSEKLTPGKKELEQNTAKNPHIWSK